MFRGVEEIDDGQRSQNPEGLGRNQSQEALGRTAPWQRVLRKVQKCKETSKEREPETGKKEILQKKKRW